VLTGALATREPRFVLLQMPRLLPAERQWMNHWCEHVPDAYGARNGTALAFQLDIRAAMASGLGLPLYRPRARPLSDGRYITWCISLGLHGFVS